MYFKISTCCYILYSTTLVPLEIKTVFIWQQNLHQDRKKSCRICNCMKSKAESYKTHNREHFIINIVITIKACVDHTHEMYPSVNLVNK